MKLNILLLVLVAILASDGGVVTASSQCVYKGTHNGTKVTIDLPKIIKFP